MSKIELIKKSKCKAFMCNHPLDPEEWDCNEKECIETGECKYLFNDE